MLDSKTILIVDGNSYAALDLSETIEESQGFVAGPVSTLPEALAILDSAEICGVVVDCDLAEATEILAHVVDRAIPAVAQVSGNAPRALPELDGKAGVLMRPVSALTILDCLLVQMAKAESPDSNVLGHRTKQV